MSTSNGHFSRFSVIFLDACTTLVVPLMCSFLIRSLLVTPHIHLRKKPSSRSFPLKFTLQDSLCHGYFRANHMSKASDFPLLNHLQQCVILPNVPYNSPVCLHVCCMRGVMHLQQSSLAIDLNARMCFSRSLLSMLCSYTKRSKWRIAF